MRVLALDPGTKETAWILWGDGRILGSGIQDNRDVLDMLDAAEDDDYTVLVCEMVGHYGTGMSPGKEVFQTCVWIGRFMQAWDGRCELILRASVKTAICGTARAKDANVRTALIDRLGPVGTKKDPGPCFGISSHKWAALAVAVAYEQDPSKGFTL